MAKGLDKLQAGNLTPAISYVKITLIFIVIVVVATSVVIGVFVYRESTKQKDDNKEQVEVSSSFVPESYYPKFRNRQELKERKEAPNEKIEEVIVTPTQKFGVQVSQQTNQSTETQKKTESNSTDLTKEELILKAKLELVADLQEQRRIALLSRRGKPAQKWNVVEPIPVIEARSKPPKEPPTDKDFSSQDIGKDVSTFPVDLSRVVTADRYIPCIIVDQINSQLAGRVTCTVERNIFGYHGRNILIPAGSKMMGSHETLKKVGDERFNVVWTRMLRPDGVHVKLTDAYASDAIGGTGVAGEVNRRNFEKYGGALLTSAISIAGQISIPTQGTNISNSVFETFSTDMGRVTAAMLNENINIKPYSIVPAGQRILVTPVTDIWLKKDEGALSFAAVNKEDK